RLELVPARDDRQSALPLPVRRLDDARTAEFRNRLPRVVERAAGQVRRLWDTRLREAVALPLLQRRQRRGLGRHGMRQARTAPPAAGAARRPVPPGRSPPPPLPPPPPPLYPPLALAGDDPPPVRVAEAGRARVAVDRDHVDAELARRDEQSELRGPRA